MRKVVTGEQLAQVYNPDPFARPVWRAPVYQTPPAVIAVVQLFRLLAWLVRLVFRHRVIALVLAVFCFAYVEIGWPGMTALIAGAAVVLAGWRVLWPGTFGWWIVVPARNGWRAWRSDQGRLGRPADRQHVHRLLHLRRFRADPGHPRRARDRFGVGARHRAGDR